MIRHVTQIRFRDDFPAHLRGRWVAGLDDLAGLPGVARLSHGSDLGLAIGQQTADYAIVADFESPEDMATYYTHPLHEELKQISGPNSKSIVTVDYLVGEDASVHPTPRRGA